MQNKRRRNKCSKFIPNLHKILNENDSGAFWREDEKSFVLYDVSKIISNSLPKYFRHSNISSFIRQLNLYGFKKLVGEQIPQNVYYHQKFKKNSLIQLKPIRSFYNQQKYGSLKRCKKDEKQVKISQSSEQNSSSQQMFKETSYYNKASEQNYKQKIEMLEKQNQRLKLIEQQHIYLVNNLRLIQGDNQFGVKIPLDYQSQYSNFFQIFQQNNTLNANDRINYGYNLSLQNANFYQNLEKFRNGFYFTF